MARSKAIQPSTSGDHRPFWQPAWYAISRVVLCTVFAIAFRYRCRNKHYMPSTGGAIVLPNHQSFFDPILTGLACDRQLNFLARESLFRFRPFAFLLRSFNSIPVARDRGGAAGLREILRRVKSGELALIFPEGTRTRDGSLGKLSKGFCLAARKSAAPLVPMAIDGAYQVWPREKKLPRLGTIRVHLAQPIMHSEYKEMSNDELTQEVARRIGDALAGARQDRAGKQTWQDSPDRKNSEADDGTRHAETPNK